MTVDDGEPGGGHVTEMTSQLHLCSSQKQPQPPAVATVCLPVSVQQLTYDDGVFHDNSEDEDCACDDGPTVDGVALHPTTSVAAAHSASALTDVSDSSTV